MNVKKHLTRFARQSPALVIATLALFVALGGTAVAAGTLITGKQVKNGSITGADVKNKSLTPRDFRGSVRGPQGPPGPAGLHGTAGPAGPQGATGAQGPVGPSDAYAASNAPWGTLPTGQWHDLLSRALPPGDYVLTAKTMLYNADYVSRTTCRLTDGTADADVAVAATTPAPAGAGYDQVALTSTASFPSGGTLVLRCLAHNDHTWAAFSRLVAVKVGALH